MFNGVFSISYDGPNALDAAPLSSDNAPHEFVLGPENGLLKTASEALLQGPHYNPLVLYGPTGVGKTHLLRLFSANYAARYPSRTVLMLNGAEFARCYAFAVDLNAVDEFRTKHREVELLVIDDLHQLARRIAAQQELLHTIDTLIDRRAQILLASQTNLAELDWMLPGLASRLSCGLTLPISRPSSETRRVLLAKIARDNGVQLTDRVANEILQGRDTESVTQLTSVLLELGNSDEHSPDTARQILARRDTSADLSPRQIINQVARHFRIKSADLVSTSRRQSTVRARGVAIYLIRRLTGISFERLGRHFGGRDHSTTLHAYRRIETNLQSDPLIRKAVYEVTQRLGVVELTLNGADTTSKFTEKTSG